MNRRSDSGTARDRAPTDVADLSSSRPMAGRRLRGLAFQVHLWTGLLTGLYLVAISVSGSILVYRNELRAFFQPKPKAVEASGSRFTEEELVRAAERSYPDHEVFVYTDTGDPGTAVSMGVNLGDSTRQILFNPYTGEDLGNAIPFGWRATSWLLDFHATLSGGAMGRRVNGIGSVALAVLAVTGIFLWWPGIRRALRQLRIERRRGRRHFLFTLHGTLGAASFVLLLLWGLTGIYLTYPEPFNAVADLVEPIDEDSLEPRFVDDVLYWIAYLHFGRFGGEPTKAIWALFGLAPPVLFGTGIALWWLRRQRAS